MSATKRLDAKEINKRGLAFRREVLEKISALATAAFGLVAALAWNSTIQELFKRIFPSPTGEGTSVWALLGYALFVTMIAVLVIIWIGRMAGRLRQLDEEKSDA